MTYASYVFAGYAITAAALAGYAAWVVGRGRQARRRLGDNPTFSGGEAPSAVGSAPENGS